MNGPAIDDLVIANATLVVPVEGTDLPGGWVAVKDGFVRAVGPSGTEPPATIRLDANGCLVTPGLVNTHHHMYQSLNRDLVIGRSFTGLVDWLEFYYPIWERIDEEAAYLSTWMSLATLAMDGCTTTSDHLNIHPRRKLIDAEIAAARQVGVRFHPTRGAMNLSKKDGRLPPDSVCESIDDILADSERLVKSYHDPKAGAMTRIALAPCNPFAVSHDMMIAAAEMAEKFDVRLHTHLAESLDEEKFCLHQYGCRPIERFEEVGWGSDRAWVAHSIYANDAEIAALARWGTGIAHCPTCSFRDTKTVAPVSRMKAAGVKIALSTDRMPSLSGEMSSARSAHLQVHGTFLSARELLEFATKGSAYCLGRTGELGQLTPGAAADIVVWPIPELAQEMTPDLLLEAWLKAGPLAPRDTIVNGKFLVRNGSLTNTKYEETDRRHKAVTADWQKFVDRR